MPTRQLTTLLLLACATGATLGADTLAPNFDRFRPTAASIGPRSAPRLSDPAIEPASFQALSGARPLQASETPRVPEPKPEPVSEAIAATQEPAAVPLPTRPIAPSRETTPPLIDKPAPAFRADPEPTGDAKDAEGSGRRLLGRSPTASRPPDKASEGLGANPLSSLMGWRPSTQTLTATGGGLAIAVGLLIATVCLIRGCLPKSARALPRDVVEVLGRAPLGGKQTTQLVRVGSKLVLVAVTPDGAEALTEITDPGEVARLVAACDAGSGRGANAEFDSMLREMSDERTTPGFLDPSDRRDEPLGFDPRSLAAAYANTPGGRGDG